MSSSFVRIPDDSGYSGPRIKTFTSTDGGNTVHQHAMVLVDQNGNPITPTAPTDTQPISGTVAISNFPATQPVSIASSVPVTGPLTDTQLRATAVPVSGTFFQATQPISGSISVSNFPATQPVSGTFFQATQPISAASLPLPSGASTETTLAAIKAKTDNLDVLLSTRTKPADTQTISGSVSISNFPASTEISNDVGNPVPVSGTFFQATQPVSGTVTARANDFQTLTGVYYYHGGANTIQASADAATAGRFWLINPVGSTIILRIKSIEFASQLGSALAAATSPRVTVERVSFTGTASGASLNPAKRKTSDASPQSSLRTTSTGLTLTAGNVIISFLPVASATAVGYTSSAVEKWKPDVDDRIDLVAGEGIVIRQPDAGTTADTRRFTVDIMVEEF